VCVCVCVWECVLFALAFPFAAVRVIAAVTFTVADAAEAVKSPSLWQSNRKSPSTIAPRFSDILLQTLREKKTLKWFNHTFFFIS